MTELSQLVISNSCDVYGQFDRDITALTQPRLPIDVQPKKIPELALLIYIDCSIRETGLFRIFHNSHNHI